MENWNSCNKMLRFLGHAIPSGVELKVKVNAVLTAVSSVCFQREADRNAEVNSVYVTRKKSKRVPDITIKSSFAPSEANKTQATTMLVHYSGNIVRNDKKRNLISRRVRSSTHNWSRASGRGSIQARLLENQKEFISRHILAAIPYGSSNAFDTQPCTSAKPKPALPFSSFGRTATNVAPLSTSPAGSSSRGAYHSSMLRAGTRVRCEFPGAHAGVTRSSCSCRASMVSSPCPSESVRFRVCSVACSAMIGWRR
ncbi:hypothetical protein ACMD2_13861 [Ananas comosus]|uniref:Uncharacterized protein n=1 Tax=Ananas comosus TaxID=4615 RepID=A0A199VRE1_ANACO|nr:hypothetical protein ACMD2_13861 [Ananas comosus]